MSEWPTFECSYQMDGSKWGFEICAENHEDAQRRIAAIAMTGKIDGQLVVSAPAYRGWYFPAWVWLKSKGWI